jgi:hypothetical protein
MRIGVGDPNLPSIQYLRGCHLPPTSGCQATPTPTSIPGFAMIPADVLTDARLSARDVRVYALLACTRRGCYASIGRQRLAKYVHADRRGIRASIKSLIGSGHIEERQDGRQRSRFRLTSEWFSGKSPGEAEVTPAPDVEAPAELLRCPKCSRSCRGLLKVGWCRSCNAELKVRRIVRDEIRKTA